MTFDRIRAALVGQLQAIPPSSAKRELELDFVRGIAILLAMGWHFNPRGGVGVPGLDQLLWPGATFGWVGVDLFFVLSGFLVGRLIFGEWQAQGHFDASRFLLRRALKLWPVLYTFVLVRMLIQPDPWDTYVPQVVFHVQNYFDIPVYHLWSLAVEEHFYLLFAAAVLLFARGKIALARVAQVAVALFVACLALRCIAVLADVPWVNIQWQTHYRIDALAFGVLMAATFVFRPDLFERLLRRRWLLLLPIALAVAVLTVFPQDSDVIATVGYSLNSLASGALILFCYRNPYLAHRNLVTVTIATLGVYSYALYIWHGGLRAVGPKLAAYVPYGDFLVVQVAFMYGPAIVLGILMTRLVEWPVLMLRERFFPAARGRRGRAADATSVASAGMETPAPNR